MIVVRVVFFLFFSSFFIVVSGCDSDSDSSVASVATVPMDTANILASNLQSDIVTESCTLSGGTVTECYKISTTGNPGTDHTMGPWCPLTINDPAVGIWPENGVANGVSGAFLANLATFYGDSNWNLLKQTEQM